VVVAFLGLSPEIEGEEMPLQVKGFDGGDRTAIELPEAQMQLVDALATTGKPLVIVLMNGSALALQSAAQKASAILEAWYPGEAGGTAIADTLFGDSNPSGRLPVTFYASTSQLPAFEDYSMKDRTYRYFTGQPLYAFGYGLNYTHFRYSNGQLSTTNLKAGNSIQVEADVENAGNRDGDETVEVYLIPKNIVGAPLRALVGFDKVRLARGATKRIQLTINPRQLSFVSPTGIRSIRPGDYDLYIGGSQPSTDSGIFLPFRIEGSSPVAP
jgi:beta-glucosidase